MIAHLNHGPWAAAVRPNLGGALLALRHDGRDVVRPSAEDITDVVQSASFPLVPYANRIAHGHFSFRGQEHRLPRNFGDHPHALHGVGWRAPWTIAAMSDEALALTLRHEGGPGWPYAFEAEQTLQLTEDSATFTLALRNLSDHVMPAGLGFHPAFPLNQATTLTARVDGVWLTDEACLPSARAPGHLFADWAEGAAVKREGLVDHCHDGWDRTLVIRQPDRMVKMVASEALDHLHVYIPEGQDYFCAEPVSHMPDALNRQDAPMPVLAPDEGTEVSMTLSVYSAADRA